MGIERGSSAKTVASWPWNGYPVRARTVKKETLARHASVGSVTVRGQRSNLAQMLRLSVIEDMIGGSWQWLINGYSRARLTITVIAL